MERRVGVIWALLVFNGLTWTAVPTLVSIPKREAQLLTTGALLLAVVFALALNRRLLIRPNVVLTLLTVLAVLALMTSVRGTAGVGALLRCFRLYLFLIVLWLLTPWWGRRDFLLARCHLQALLWTLATVVVGLIIVPSRALAGVDGRLVGALWPIWPTAVAHYAAMAAGIAAVLWLAKLMPGSRALLLGSMCVTIILLSKTRVALVGLGVGVLFGALSLFISRVRVRRVVVVALIAAPLAAVVLAPAVSAYFTRNQTTKEVAGLSGRKQVWAKVANAPRSEFGKWFGYGLSDKSFDGLPIDSSWFAVYQDQGLAGVGIIAVILTSLFVVALRAPPGPRRALALFIIVYCAVDSYTEVGLGDASIYLLELSVAGSLVIPRAAARFRVADPTSAA